MLFRSFSYAGKTFKGVLEKDPQCAMAYWGIALDLMGNTLGGAPRLQEAKAGLEAIEKGLALNAKTQRERDWIAAAGQYFRGYNDTPLETRLLAYTRAMEQITQRYPDDYEAWVFYALTLQASAPKDDLKYANQIKSAAILDKMYSQNPKHPGVSHFLIHAFDYPPLAEKGIAAARRYAGIAPAVPHARHMPSHIYSMVGLWEESIASNARALEIQPDYRHASDFTVYAHLQLAQDAQAKAVMEKSAGVPDRGDRPVGGGNFTALAAMPARYMLERADWQGAAKLPITKSAFPMADAITRFTRGLGMARTGDLAGAQAEVAAIAVHRSALEKTGQKYWADRSEEQMLAVTAWIHYANGRHDDALKFMRAAADGEDGSVKHILMENRHGLCADFTLHNPITAAEPVVALRQLDAHRELHAGVTPKTLGGDKGYHRKDFVSGCRERAVVPHPACKTGIQVPGLDGRTTRQTGYRISQRIRKRVEEIFGWVKTVGGLRRSRYRGLERTQAWGYFVVSTYNLLRMARLDVARTN